jgi:hypothetical protein
MRPESWQAMVVGALAWSGLAAAGPKQIPSDAQCKPLPALVTPVFSPGEDLEYDIDVLTANAARMEVQTLPASHGELPIQVEVKTNTFFNKVRKVKAESRSYLSPKTLRADRYTEDAWEDEEHKVADVDFHPKNQPPQSVIIRYVTNPQSGGRYISVNGRYAHDALDVLGAIYLIRSLDLKPGLQVCFDAYAMRHMWRVWGTIGDVEKVATKAGEFSAFHLSGTAGRLDNPSFQRDLDLWITDDAERIPVGAVGGIDLGPVRATLVHLGRPNDQQPKQSRIDDIHW